MSLLLRSCLIGLSLAFLSAPSKGAAFALPPRKIELSYDWLRDIKGLTPIRPLQIEALSRFPIVHGILKLKDNQVLTLNADGTQLLSFDLRSRSADAPEKSKSLKTDLEQEKWLKELSPDEPGFFKEARGYFQHSESRLDFLGLSPNNFPLWSIELGFRPVRVESAPREQGLTAWSDYPPRLVQIPARLDLYYTVHWSEDSEPVHFWSCDSQRSLVVENLRNGMSRLVFFGAGMRPVGYTILDLSGDARKSDISAALSPSCEEIFMAGSFGLVRVRYNRFF